MACHKLLGTDIVKNAMSHSETLHFGAAKADKQKVKSLSGFLNYLIVLAIIFNGGLYFYFREKTKAQVSLISTMPIPPRVSGTATKLVLTKPKPKPTAATAPSPAEPVVRVLIDNTQATQDRATAITNELVPWLIATSKGDPAVVRKLIEDAKADPEAFLKRLPASMQDEILKLVPPPAAP